MLDNEYTLRALFAGSPVPGYQAFLDVDLVMKREAARATFANSEVEIDSSGERADTTLE
jgi:hypothetical protein